MARLRDDTTGTVSVEFLIVFFPIFLFFLGICQYALLTSAGMLVHHAAWAGVRAAIVILNDKPSHYGDVKCGDLSTTSNNMATPGALAILAKPAQLFSQSNSSSSKSSEPQHGARMASIRIAAVAPLAILSRTGQPSSTQGDSLYQALRPDLSSKMQEALTYAAAATAVSIHSGDDEGLIPEPVAKNATVTVRVTYFFECTVPLVRYLMCNNLSSLLDDSRNSRLIYTSSASDFHQLVDATSRYQVFDAKATLPNQGADYPQNEDEETEP